MRVCLGSHVVTKAYAYQVLPCIFFSERLYAELNFHKVLHDSSSIFVVMPFAEGGELFDRVSTKERLGEMEARPLFRQVLEGVAFLQRNGVCHRYANGTNEAMQTSGEYAVIVPRTFCSICVTLLS